ncbi:MULTISPECIES: alpha/beta fold hydrolase [Marinomonas]|uniref:Alpha/beta hydrolase n=1 Tax=Marinomonas arctica TaxID=383750 RepID=A0A7H1J7D2_9GAMM|nr:MULTISPECIES: alpha/beta hydrolase [Marinomonas]QNT06398.1 alpha/beta hydrolase [Marinomonas arctica]GGN28153.1 acetoin dehydrogenase [Marinomonas arctica]
MEDLYTSVQGYTIRYRDTGGEKPVLLLTHGIGSSLETWEAQADALADHLRVISWDLPGHGLSDIPHDAFGIETYARFAWYFLDALKIDQTIVGGNSMGGGISVHMMNAYPERVTHAVLLNAAGLGKDSPLPFRLMSLPILGDLMSKPGKMAIDNQIKAIFYNQEEVTDKSKAIIARNVMREGAQAAFVATLKEITTIFGQRKSLYSKTLAILSATKKPVLFIHGRHDVVIPLAHSQHAQAMTPASKLIILEECGHTPQLEKPVEVNKRLTEFLLEHEA